ncbi:protein DETOXIFICATION 29 isoform X2 [Hevea brasiliensis]|uniref:protein DETOXIFICATION 29 isoform X2 n=1 Tax=Hevea brasiliensis TaxID=3981 RepID=UPI0025E52AC3|nr:protein DETOXIFICATION 29 isoform X2 [Hevea brasiliensis]
MEDSSQDRNLYHHQDQDELHSLAISTTNPNSSVPDAHDIPPINTIPVFFREFYRESKKLWYLAFPAMFTSLCQYSIGAITQVFSGQVGTLALAAVSIENSVIAGFSFGALLGMGSALETLCGQAFGAGQLEMLGIYMQRSWVILGTAASLLSMLYIFATQILKLIGQKAAISKAAGIFSIWMIPQLFAYSINFPMAKFLQAQRKMIAMALISAATLVLHALFSWLLILKLRWGLVGAAVVLNASWWFVDLSQFLYIVSGTCGRAWNGFSWQAFQNLWGFVRLSLASAVMLCVEVWYYMALIIFAGYLKNAEISVDALSICVRVSNELGAGHPRTAKFSVAVAVISSFTIGVIISVILILTRNKYPSLFSKDSQVKELVKKLTPLLATSVVINNVQPVLCGVAIGAGWQAIMACVNIVCYYVFGIPLGLILGYKLDMGVHGIWFGMMSGNVVQTFALFFIVYRTNWSKEASVAEDRIRKWKGQVVSIENNTETIFA